MAWRLGETSSVAGSVIEVELFLRSGKGCGESFSCLDSIGFLGLGDSLIQMKQVSERQQELCSVVGGVLG